MNLKYKKAAKAKLLQQERAWTVIHACLDKPVWVHPGETAVIPSGVEPEVPTELVGLLCSEPAGGLELAQGQLWDADSKEYAVSVRNVTQDRIRIEHGQSIARLVMLPWYPVKWKEAV